MTKDEALNIAIDYMKERLEEHDAKFQRHPVAEAERNNILADIGAVKEALSQPEPWEKFCDSNCVWTDHHPDCKLAEQEPVAAAKKDEVFAASIEFIGTLTGMTPPPIEIAPPEVFKPFRDFTEKVCLILNTTPPHRLPLTDEEIEAMWPLRPTESIIQFARAIEAAHGIKGEA